MNNYYEDILNEIIDLIENQKYKLAQDLIDEELKMIYIPSWFEKKLKELNSKLQNYNPKKIIFNKLNCEQILELLFKEKNEENQLKYVFDLNNFNLEKYKKTVLNLFLLENIYATAKTHLIFILKEQKWTNEIVVHKNNNLFYLNLSKIDIDDYAKTTKKVIDFIYDNIWHNDISLYNLCLELVRVFYDFYFPEIIDFKIFKLLGISLIQKALIMLNQQSDEIIHNLLIKYSLKINNLEFMIAKINKIYS